MGIYFRDILPVKYSGGANNCGQKVLEKNISFFTASFEHIISIVTMTAHTHTHIYI